MAHIFMDESGDLGFDFGKKRTSKFFIVTFLFVSNPRSVEKIVKEVHRGLRSRFRMRSGILHASHEEPITCLRFCRRLVGKDCQVMVIYLNKSRVYSHLQDEKHVLYNYVVNILLGRIIGKRLAKHGEEIELIASRRETNKFLNQNFKEYLERQVTSNHGVNIRVTVKTPSEEKCLQAADMVSWAMFRKYEYGDESYYDIVKPLVIEENGLYK